MRSSLHVLVALSFLVLGEHAARAEAGTQTQCYDPNTAPSDGSTVPANAPAAFLYQVIPDDGVSDARVGGLPSHVAAEPVWPADEKILVLDALPVVGQKYDTSFTLTCAGGRVETPFTTHWIAGPPSELPSSVGEAIGAASTRGSRQAGIDIRPTAELLAYRAMMRFTVKVDGENATVDGRYGPPLNQDGTITAWGDAWAGLTTSGCGDAGPSTKVRTFTVHAHVAGAATDPPDLESTITLDCAQNPYRDRPSAPSATPTPTETGGQPSAAQEGCSIASSDAEPSPLFWVSPLVVAFGLTLRRRAR